MLRTVTFESILLEDVNVVLIGLTTFDMNVVRVISRQIVAIAWKLFDNIIILR